MYLAEPMNRVDFGAIRSKVMRLILHAKVVYERIVIRTDGWITVRLGTCISCKANELIRF